MENDDFSVNRPKRDVARNAFLAAAEKGAERRERYDPGKAREGDTPEIASKRERYNELSEELTKQNAFPKFRPNDPGLVDSLATETRAAKLKEWNDLKTGLTKHDNPHENGHGRDGPDHSGGDDDRNR